MLIYSVLIKKEVKNSTPIIFATALDLMITFYVFMCFYLDSSNALYSTELYRISSLSELIVFTVFIIFFSNQLFFSNDKSGSEKISQSKLKDSINNDRDT